MSSALALTVALAGCPGNVKDAFPKSVGYQPLTYCPQIEVPWPTDPVDPGPETLNVLAAPGCGGSLNPDTYVVTDQAHARGYLKKPLLTVWNRMQPGWDGDPNWIRLCQNGETWIAPGSRCVDSWHWIPGGETADFPVSFVMRYHVNEIISVDWELTWREGPLVGTVAAPQAVGARYQKTWGIENLRVETGSFVLKPAPDDTCTSVELVGWLDADQSDQNSVAGTLMNAYALLKIGVYTP